MANPSSNDRLALELAHLAGAEEQPFHPAPAPGRPCILVVDDDADMRAYCCDCLDEHYDIVEAADGLEALALAHRRRPRLVISDVVMPCLDGYGLCRALQAAPDLCGIPVLLVTGEAGGAPDRQALAAGAAAFLAKPFNAGQLTALVMQLTAEPDGPRPDKALEA